MNERRLYRASRFMAWALRHAPVEAGITLDARGWTSVSDLLHSLYQHHLAISAGDLAKIVASDEKGRFSLSDDQQRIRANYAHSMTVDLGLPARKPPSWLFHGTARRYLEAIKREGILRQHRQFVHLVTDLLMAFAIGRRHGEPVAVTVDSQAMYDDGQRFYHGAGAIWMTETVPPQYLRYDRLYYPEVG